MLTPEAEIQGRRQRVHHQTIHPPSTDRRGGETPPSPPGPIPPSPGPRPSSTQSRPRDRVLPPLVGIKGISQAITDEVDAQNRQKDRQTGEEGHMGRNF